jgi:hypothetical protein
MFNVNCALSLKKLIRALLHEARGCRIPQYQYVKIGAETK